MQEKLYIDVVSKTIISGLSELIAQHVGDHLSEEIKKVLLTKLPGVIGDEISPALSKARKDAQETAKISENKVFEQLKAIKGQVDKSFKAQEKLPNETQYDLLSEMLQGDMQNLGAELTTGLANLKKEMEEKILVSEGAVKNIIDKSRDEIKKHILANSEKTHEALNNIESFMRNELSLIQNILAGSLDKKEDDGLHDKILNSIQKLVSAHDKINVDVEKLQNQSKQEIDVMNVQISDFENEKAKLNSALKESTDFAENLQILSQKEITNLQAKIDELETEKTDQKQDITHDLSDINALKNQLFTANEELTKNEIVTENAVQEKIAMENKLTAIQELWEKQQVR